MIQKGSPCVTMSQCTYAVSGPHMVFQPIYVISAEDSEKREVTVDGTTDGNGTEEKEEELLSICQACADVCHEGDPTMEFIGIGPSYCDCSRLGNCQILMKSQLEAQRLGVLNSLPWTHNAAGGILSTKVLTMPVLCSRQGRQHVVQLKDQAEKLIQHSKETFWIDTSCMPDPGQMCELERLASDILLFHSKQIANVETLGAEWWVQVKEPGKDASVDLHYDKDEDMAEVFGLASFPAISTVTYLTGSIAHRSPTVILQKKYEESEHEPIPRMLVSHPRVGKHIAFDGSLLHGVPAHLDLVQSRTIAASQEDGCAKRVTFLVNLWPRDKKPAGVKPLPNFVRSSISTSSTTSFPLVELVPDDSALRSIKLKRDTACSYKEIEIPFLGGNTTWGKDEDEAHTVVVAMIPTQQDESSHVTLYEYGPNLEAFMQYREGDMDYPNELQEDD